MSINWKEFKTYNNTIHPQKVVLLDRGEIRTAWWGPRLGFFQYRDGTQPFAPSHWARHPNDPRPERRVVVDELTTNRQQVKEWLFGRRYGCSGESFLSQLQSPASVPPVYGRSVTWKIENVEKLIEGFRDSIYTCNEIAQRQTNDPAVNLNEETEWNVFNSGHPLLNQIHETTLPIEWEVARYGLRSEKYLITIIAQPRTQAVFRGDLYKIYYRGMLINEEPWSLCRCKSYASCAVLVGKWVAH